MAAGPSKPRARSCAAKSESAEENWANRVLFFVLLVAFRNEEYVYLVPFPPSPAGLRCGLRRGLAVALRAEADVEDEQTVFLKTIIPSRRPRRSTSVKRPT